MLAACCCASPVANVSSQSVVLSKDFRLTSPFSEPDGRNDVVKINATDFIAIAKVKGSQTGKSDFVIERYNQELNSLWQSPVSVDSYEDFREMYFNGKDLVLLSVVHKEAEKKTKLEAYGFDIKDGKKIWTKELESFDVGDWEMHPHKGKVKESFTDLICEHTSQDFITPFEYKHNIQFSPDQSKFVSYVYNYGDPNLTASVSVYDNSGNLLKRGKIAIDNDYTNYGVYVNNDGMIYILNANNIGKVNLIQYNLDTKNFELLDLPPSNYMKDDFHVHFQSNDVVFVGNSEVKDGKIFGVMYSKFNFNTKKVELSIYEELDAEFKTKVINDRKNYKQVKGEEDWLDYDITQFIVDKNEEVLIVLEKRALHADGYPHLGRGTFDKSHKVEFTGHVQAETILFFAFDNQGDLTWKNYLIKNQVYPANDGLNTISYVMDSSQPSTFRILYTSSENMDGSLHSLNLYTFDRKTGVFSKKILPNENKLTLVKDYSLFTDDNSLIIVGKKGLLGKASMIVKYKL
jgi:hypothetical protein